MLHFVPWSVRAKMSSSSDLSLHQRGEPSIPGETSPEKAPPTIFSAGASFSLCFYCDVDMIHWNKLLLLFCVPFGGIVSS